MLGLTDFAGTRQNREEEEEEASAPHATSLRSLSHSFLFSAKPNVIFG
jgi:hypothetical protein